MEARMNYNENRHPQHVMEELGINYQHSVPQSIADQWWFFNCVDVPDNLPGYIRKLNLDPLDQVGDGLSQQEAEKIKANEKNGS